MMTITEALALAASLRVPSGEAQVLLAHLLEQPRTWVIAHPSTEIDEDLEDRYANLVARAAQGEPLAYLLGAREFYRLPFVVTPAVLIPRPETEHLVDAALAWARQRSRGETNGNPQQMALHAADVGTGSGIIAICLAAYYPSAWIVGVDASAEALAVAKQNARRLRVSSRVDWMRGDLLGALRGPFDLITANLPYIPSVVLDRLDVGYWEPRAALDGGPDGLEAIRALLEQAPARLAPGGLLLLEIGYDQGRAVTELCRAAFPNARIDILPDLAGHDRVAQVQA
jgi:release factor glutamine methyltransferase